MDFEDELEGVGLRGIEVSVDKAIAGCVVDATRNRWQNKTKKNTHTHQLSLSLLFQYSSR
jgi:hypothetical protein